MARGKSHADNRRANLGRWIAPLRFLLSGALAVLVGVVAASKTGWHHGALIGFDLGATAFLGSLLPLLKDAGAAEMRQHAARNDANRGAFLAIAAFVMLVILLVVAVELGHRGGPSAWVIGLIVGTLVLAWLFTNTVFSLHYAHMYYVSDEITGLDKGGIDFPSTPEPDYWDFIYFGYCLGMTFQTSDSNLTSGRFRRVVTLHCLIAFIFSIGVIAFSINVLGSAGGQ